MIIFYSVLTVILLLIAVMLMRSAKFVPDNSVSYESFDVEVDEEGVSKRLSDAIKIKTISSPDVTKVDWKQFTDFREYLEKTYPLIHKTMEREIIADYSLMFKWTGKSQDKKPLAMLSHMDVVPVMPGTEKDWKHDAFSGDDEDGFVWGRGTLDMKGHLISVCEAAEKLISEGYEPNCDVYLCFGHNEEVVGATGGGAKSIAETLKERGVELGMVIDEGGAVVPGTMFGLDEGNMAVVGIAEKGYADIKVTCKKKGGHSSQPPKDNGLVDLGKIITKLDKNQRKARMTEPTKNLFKTVGPYMSFLMRFMLSNLWITKPVVLKALGNSPATNAMIRTTITPTMAEGSPAGNILPQTANISINSRVMQGEKIQDVFNHIKNNAKGIDIELELLRGKEPSGISPVDCEQFACIKKTVNEVHGKMPVAPYLMTGGTDSCFYEIVTDKIYCVGPFVMSKEDLTAIHGTNEKINKQVLANGVKFFYRLINNYCE